MSSTAATRRRPLRTYGRQQAPAPLSTTSTPNAPELPPTKRRRISSNNDSSSPVTKSAGASSAAAAHTERPPAAAPAATTPPREQKDRQSSSTAEERVPALPILPPTSTARRSTITSYFRVVPHLKSETSSCTEEVTSSDSPSAAISTSSPPSSPPPSRIQLEESRGKRKPRRLTTKAKPRDLPRTTIDGEGGGEDKASQDESEDDTGTKEVNGGIMAAVNTCTLNRGASTRTSATAADKSSAAPVNLSRKRQRPEAMIQQTLSLSMSEKGFTECAECSMLYNPLHEKDRRFHARQHAAVLKARELKGDVVDE